MGQVGRVPLRWGAATDEQQDLILSRLRQGDFLDRYGVHSVSPQDALHYEVIDIDWSGNGAFTGDPQNLVEILYEIGRPHLAWDVLKRLLWMGILLPIYPQEHHAGKPVAGRRGRPNIIAGLAGAQAVIFGMLGINIHPDGSISFNPQLPDSLEIELANFRYRGRTFNLNCSSTNCEIRMDSKLIDHSRPIVL